MSPSVDFLTIPPKLVKPPNPPSCITLKGPLPIWVLLSVFVLLSNIRVLSFMSLPVVVSYKATALFVALDGPTTSPSPLAVELMIGLFGSVASIVILSPATTDSRTSSANATCFSPPAGSYTEVCMSPKAPDSSSVSTHRTSVSTGAVSLKTTSSTILSSTYFLVAPSWADVGSARLTILLLFKSWLTRLFLAIT